MGTMKVLLSILLCALILAAVPAVRAEAGQCTASLSMISTTGHASAADECHFQSTPDKQPVAARVSARGNSSVGPVVFRTWSRVPRDLQSATACRLNAAHRADMPIQVLTESLLI